MNISKTYIAVFGGTNYSNSSVEYSEAYKLGKMLAQSDFNLINGAGGGLMEATAKGTIDGGGKVLGAMINDARFSLPNKYNSKLVEAEDLFTRIRQMYNIASGFVTLRGGTGTFAEFAMIWNLLSLDPGPKKPLILVGRHWSNFIEEYKKHFLTTAEEMKTIEIVNQVEEAISALNISINTRE
jgi:uncharacterized protein (TIGR00730 family)